SRAPRLPAGVERLSSAGEPAGVLHGRVFTCRDNRAAADLEVDDLQAVRVGHHGQSGAGAEVVSTRRGARGPRAFVGDRAGARIWVGVTARRRRNGGQGEDGEQQPPHEAVMPMDVIVSPTWILSTTSMPEVIWPKWL